MKLSLCLLLFLTVLASAPVETLLSVTLSHANGLRGDGWFGKTDGYVKVRTRAASALKCYQTSKSRWIVYLH
jgi:hypothetical protein